VRNFVAFIGASKGAYLIKEWSIFFCDPTKSYVRIKEKGIFVFIYFVTYEAYPLCNYCTRSLDRQMPASVTLGEIDIMKECRVPCFFPTIERNSIRKILEVCKHELTAHILVSGRIS